MIGYYLRLALISIRGNLVLSALMVAAIGLGIGLCMTVLTVNYVMGKDPIPEKSGQLFYVRLDSWDPNEPADEPNEPPQQVTYTDAVALMDAHRAYRQIASHKVSLVIEPENRDVRPFLASGRSTFADFFPMFNVPFQFGAGWDAQADAGREQVVVITREMNDRIFGGQNSVGRNLELSGHLFRVVGVLDKWQPEVKFYDILNGPFDDVEDVYIPFNLTAPLELPRSGNTNCWKMPEGSGFQAFLTSECVWIQFWVELRNETEKAEYKSFLDSYVEGQKALGRFQRPLNNRLQNVVEWLDDQKVVQDEARMLLAVSIMFLAVCLLNTIGLLLSKFLGKSGEVGVRRALGAPRSSLFVQFLVESGCIGVAGGVLGLGLAWLGLRGIDYLFQGDAAHLVNMDWVMVLTAIVIAIVSAVIAGLYPTWRACNVQPALQLKAQ